MEENSECKDCKTWEERLYWKHFNSMHFFVTLPSDFHHHLKLPEKFSAHMKAQLPNEVSLKGPSGVAWEIELLKSDDLFFVGDEWKGFVKANDLKENCLLVFTFKRNSNIEVLIFDQGSSCEKESAYFVKKCRHTESEDDNEDTKKRTVRETASSTEVMEEEDGEEGSEHVTTKKSKGDDEAVFNSGGRVNTSTPRKRVRNVAAKSRGRARRVVLPRKSPNKPEVLSRKNPVRNAPANEQRDMIDMITPESGEISPDNDQAHEFESQSKKSKEPKQISREVITPQKRKVSPAEDHSVMKKGQFEKPRENNAPKEPRSNPPTGNGESFQAVAQNLEAKSEKRLREHDTSKEPSQNTEKELNTPEKGEYTPVTDCSQAEKESIGRGSAKMIRPDYRESSLEDDRPFNSRGKRGRGRGRGRGRPKMQVLPKSSKKLEFNSEIVSQNRRFSKEYMSNRRPVTQMEIDTTFRRACRNLTGDSFTAIMRPTSVYKRFFLTIPVDWLQKHLPSRNQEVILRVGEKTWHTNLFIYGTNRAGFSTGWKKFALENFLEEFDVLVFKLVSQNDDEAVVMDVDVFRVVDDIVPVLPVTSQAK